MVNKKFIIPRNKAIRGFFLSVLIIIFILGVSAFLIFTSSSTTQIVAFSLLLLFGVIIIIHLNGGIKELALRKDSIKLKPK